MQNTQHLSFENEGPLIDLIVWILAARSQWFIRCSSARIIPSPAAPREAKSMGLFVAFGAVWQSGKTYGIYGPEGEHLQPPETTGLCPNVHQFSIFPQSMIKPDFLKITTLYIYI